VAKATKVKMDRDKRSEKAWRKVDDGTVKKTFTVLDMMDQRIATQWDDTESHMIFCHFIC